jgi:hypothetical protein
MSGDAKTTDAGVYWILATMLAVIGFAAGGLGVLALSGGHAVQGCVLLVIGVMGCGAGGLLAWEIAG